MYPYNAVRDIITPVKTLPIQENAPIGNRFYTENENQEAKDRNVHERRDTIGKFCAYCKGDHFRKNGLGKNKSQKYTCKGNVWTCGISSLSMLLKTKEELWEKLLDCMPNHKTSDHCIGVCGITHKTAFV